MTISALLLPTDADPETREVEPSPTGLRELLNGGWMEAVCSGEDWLVLADEEGRIKQLPINKKATALARHLGWPGDYLVGPVVVVGLADRGGEDGPIEADVPPRIVEAVSA